MVSADLTQQRNPCEASILIEIPRGPTSTAYEDGTA